MTTLSPTTTPVPLRKETEDMVTNLILTALTAVAALSWRDAFKTLFTRGGFFAEHALLGPWVVAVIATIAAIAGTRTIKRFYPSAKKLD